MNILLRPNEREDVVSIEEVREEHLVRRAHRIGDRCSDLYCVGYVTTRRCHLCNDIFTRPDTREVLHANASKARDRIAMHRAFLEAARADEELAGLYVKT